MVDIGRRESSTLDTMRNLLRSNPQRSFSIAMAHSVWHTHKIQILLRWITRRGFLQCKYAFLVCQPGIKSTCGGGQHKIILGQHYIVTLKWIVWSQLWILGDYTTHATQFSEISSGFLIQSGPIVVVIVDSVPILLLKMKSAQ